MSWYTVNMSLCSYRAPSMSRISKPMWTHWWTCTTTQSMTTPLSARPYWIASGRPSKVSTCELSVSRMICCVGQYFWGQLYFSYWEAWRTSMCKEMAFETERKRKHCHSTENIIALKRKSTLPARICKTFNSFWVHSTCLFIEIYTPLHLIISYGLLGFTLYLFFVYLFLAKLISV